MNTTVIGLTGQTGAGKSTISRFAAALSCRIIDADRVAREVVEKGSPCLQALADFFGSDILQKDGSLDRRRLAQKAFASQEKTEMLGRLTHPAILDRIRGCIAAADSDIVIVDAPQLYESGGEVLCDRVIAVVAPEQVRLERIMERDGLTEEEARLRIHAQHDSSYYTEKADYLINGSAPLADVQSKIQDIISAVRQEETK